MSKNVIKALFLLIILLLGGVVQCIIFDINPFNSGKLPKTEIGDPKKDNFWLFVLAGQSNMAGRAPIEPIDTLRNSRILSLSENLTWEIAQEPLHFYEPQMQGLDCGVAFATEMLSQVPDSISIGLIPCAVGGSSVDHWLNDKQNRGVKLLSNFGARVEKAKKEGVIKAILWHQGENDAKSHLIPKYDDNIRKLFTKFRDFCSNPNLPILVGELGSYKDDIIKQTQWDSINTILHEFSRLESNVYLVETSDLDHMGDFTHFDSKSQRQLGVRFARTFLETLN